MLTTIECAQEFAGSGTKVDSLVVVVCEVKQKHALALALFETVVCLLFQGFINLLLACEVLIGVLIYQRVRQTCHVFN